MTLGTMPDEKRNRIVPSNNHQLLRDYHDASKRLEKRHAEDITDPEKEADYHEFCTAARELISRCIIADKPRGLCFLILELTYLAKVIGAGRASEHLTDACNDLHDFFRENEILS